MQPNARPAYSLIFAFVVMTVILLVAGATIQNTNEKVAFYNEMEGSSQAYLAAQSAAELGVDSIQDADGDGTNDYSPGFESDDEEVFCQDSDADGNCNSWADFIVLSEQKYAAPNYYTPIFGTGTAGNSEDCSVLDYIDLDTGETDTSVTIDVDDPCHWNKLLYSQTVTIPLFDTDDNTGAVSMPYDMGGFTSWNLRVRAPCNDGSMDSTCTRYQFEDGVDGDGSVYEEDDAILHWQLIAEDSAGTDYVLIPDDDYDEDRYGEKTRSWTYVSNTEIYESLINAVDNPGSYTTLFVDNDWFDPFVPLYNFTMGDTNGDWTVDTPDAVYTSLVLQLNVETPLVDEDGLPIPYLEWQLMVESDEAFADTKAVIVGEGFSEFLRNTFYFPYVLLRSTVGESANVYTLSN